MPPLLAGRGMQLHASVTGVVKGRNKKESSLYRERSHAGMPFHRHVRPRSICGGLDIGLHRTRKGPGARPVLWGFSTLQPRK